MSAFNLNIEEYVDNTEKIKKIIDEKAVIFLEEAKSSLSSQASRNSPVDTGALKASFQTDSVVDESERIAYIGSSLEYSIWQELGTGEYALSGNGRKGGWVYKNLKTGKYVFTKGNKPQRMLYHAYEQKKQAIINRARQLFKEI